jgi:glycosyltransferase involved in cell wall biosynthesis
MKSDLKTILIFTDWYLPGFKAGGPITSVSNLVNNLEGKFIFKIVCGDRDYQDRAPYANIQIDRWQKHHGEERMYLSPARQKLSVVKEIVKRVNPDAVYLNGMFSKAFTIFPLWAMRGGNTRVILAPRGMLAPSALNIKGGKKSLFLNLAKALGLYKNVHFHATNRDEADQVEHCFPNHPYSVVSNLPRLPQQALGSHTHEKQTGSLRTYMVARVAPEKNIHFALECFKLIKSQREIHLDIIGEVYSAAYYAECQRVIEELPENVKVSFVGAMHPNEIDKYVVRADLFYMPTKGENYGHAIVEAMLAGKPVLISDRTPWKNLSEQRLGFDLALDPQLFANKLLQFAEMSSESYRRAYADLGARARSLINIDKLQREYQALFNGED